MHISRPIYPFEDLQVQPRIGFRPILACAMIALLAMASPILLSARGMQPPYGGDLAAFGP